MTVGDGVIIGAGAVVTHDVPAFAIVAGVPATVLRMRFDPAQIVAIQQDPWWRWPIERLRSAGSVSGAGGDWLRHYPGFDEQRPAGNDAGR